MNDNNNLLCCILLDGEPGYEVHGKALIEKWAEVAQQQKGSEEVELTISVCLSVVLAYCSPGSWAGQERGLSIVFLCSIVSCVSKYG